MEEEKESERKRGLAVYAYEGEEDLRKRKVPETRAGDEDEKAGGRARA